MTNEEGPAKTTFIPKPDHPFEDLEKVTKPDGTKVWVFRGDEAVDAHGQPFTDGQVFAFRRQIREGELGMVILGICQWCMHKSPDNFLTCQAYPRGIPEPIAAGDFDHREPFEGDNGIRFEQRPEAHLTKEDFERVLPGLS